VTSARVFRIGLLASLATQVLLANAALAQPKMLFVGDSITRGTGALDPSQGGFTAQIGQRFPEVLVANAGCGGSTIRDWTIERGNGACAIGDAWNLLASPELPAQITHVMLGTNGARGGRFEFFGPISPPEYEARLRMLVERAPGLVLISSAPVSAARPYGAIDDRLRGYRDAIALIVSEYEYAEHGVDAYALLDPRSDFVADGIHPNDQGHTRIADELERQLLLLLPRGSLSPCKNARACGRFSFLPQYRHPKGRPSLR
jgi:lysophospholipase L1-like esterase